MLKRIGYRYYKGNTINNPKPTAKMMDDAASSNLLLCCRICLDDECMRKTSLLPVCARAPRSGCTARAWTSGAPQGKTRLVVYPHRFDVRLTSLPACLPAFIPYRPSRSAPSASRSMSCTAPTETIASSTGACASRGTCAETCLS